MQHMRRSYSAFIVTFRSIHSNQMMPFLNEYNTVVEFSVFVLSLLKWLSSFTSTQVPSRDPGCDIWSWMNACENVWASLMLTCSLSLRVNETAQIRGSENLGSSGNGSCQSLMLFLALEQCLDGWEWLTSSIYCNESVVQMLGENSLTISIAVFSGLEDKCSFRKNWTQQVINQSRQATHWNILSQMPSQINTYRMNRTFNTRIQKYWQGNQRTINLSLLLCPFTICFSCKHNITLFANILKRPHSGLLSIWELRSR